MYLYMIEMSTVMLFTFSFDMASASGPTYTTESVLLAIEDVHSHNKLTMRKAAQQYDIPKSTLALYVSGKLQMCTVNSVYIVIVLYVLLSVY